MNTTKKRILFFVVTVFILTYAVDFLLMSNGGLENQKASRVLSVMLLFPAFSVITAQFLTREGFKNSYLKLNFRANISRYLVSYFLVQVLIIVGAAVYFLIFRDRFDYGLASLSKMIFEQTGEQPLQSRLVGLMAVQIIFSLLSGPFMNIFFAFGEEYGWRGYLFPKLCELFSPLKASVLTGILHGIWYVPLICMGYIYKSDYIGFPFSGIGAMIIFCVLTSIIFSYFTYKTKSVFPSVLMRGALSVFSSSSALFEKYDANPFIGPEPYGIIGCVGFIVCAAVLAILLKKEKAPSFHDIRQ